jgi:putative MATE family efflux protein
MLQKHKSTALSSFFLNLKDAFLGKEQDYTQGSIRKAIFLLSVPMILEMAMESLFAIIDIYFVSQVSVHAVGTVGLTESVITLVYAIAVGLSMAATAIVARRTGEKDPEGASNAASQVIILGVVLALITGSIGILFPREILALMGGEPELIEEGYGFTKILIGGNITIMLLFLINAVFRGAGNAAIAMQSLVLANTLNIILDPIFIFGFWIVPAYGVEGAAIATTIGRGTAVLFQLYMLQSKKGRIRIDFRKVRLQIGVMLNLIKISLGGIGQFLIGTSSWIFLMRIISEFGSEVLAGYTIAIRIIMFTILPAWGMSNAAATLVGQNLGAQKPDRAEKSVWKTAKYNMLFMLSVSLIYILLADYIVALFSEDTEVLRHASNALRLISTGYIFYGYGMVMTQSFNGAGDTKTPTYINFFSFWIFQLPLAYITAIVFEIGPNAVFLSIAIAESVLALSAIIIFRKGKWKTTQV